MRPIAALSESILDSLDSDSPTWGISDAVYHLDNGILGGTMTYTGAVSWAWRSLYALLNESGIDASDLISYFSIEEVTD